MPLSLQLTSPSLEELKLASVLTEKVVLELKNKNLANNASIIIMDMEVVASPLLPVLLKKLENLWKPQQAMEVKLLY